MPLTKIGFYSSSAGHNFDRMYGLFLCRGNTSPELCQSCIKTTSEDIMNRCLNNKKEIIWHPSERKRKKEDDEMRKEEDDVFALIFFFQKSNQ
uniref:Gnk2-homologous domain-containing protein n=1 Tax=Populus trichocarpa TaxID=3694 RepID=A0A2K2AYS0_POPTR